MKKLPILVILILCLFGCQNAIYYWEFEYSCDQIKEIKIVNIVDESDFSVIKEIDLNLAADIYEDISKLEMQRYGTNLSSPSGKCFMIVFLNGEYDIISQKESKHFKHVDSDTIGYNSWLYCDESEFEALINKYLDSTVDALVFTPQ